jgi:hypothetical protein
MRVIVTVASPTVGHQLLGALAVILVAAIIGGAIAMVVRLLTGPRRLYWMLLSGPASQSRMAGGIGSFRSNRKNARPRSYISTAGQANDRNNTEGNDRERTELRKPASQSSADERYLEPTLFKIDWALELLCFWALRTSLKRRDGYWRGVRRLKAR